ncbi:gamma-glutamylcyclotransferase family protein [Pseudovibrio sp. Tun.PSC04-5.I4]|uniref:gamma-glutamylcyclotransferase family protein n=1 Tax=Pseudovibrio sp. Tun.PSC04-5.I4 TaxID=1798213 RepID=UPI00089072AA|nr:gamma-glutamylcyclotransferase family protein [Pseudovibrio sp. Tun.PSC04-5.I4]SDR39058.1 Gamma-glutamyl cyclotransferase, AIG2-like [Pseudovibrio sp. Tun.PSC04-5.I4]
MPIYFAYGRLLDPKIMASRCPNAKALGPASMGGYRFIVTSEGVPSMVKSPGKTVHGVLWDCRVGEIAVVDGAEALFRKGLDKVFLAVRFGQQSKSAILYVSRTAKTGKPHIKAWEGVMSGAAHWQFPELYREELRQWDLR